jgi:hypothetical protein
LGNNRNQYNPVVSDEFARLVEAIQKKQGLGPSDIFRRGIRAITEGENFQLELAEKDERISKVARLLAETNSTIWRIEEDNEHLKREVAALRMELNKLAAKKVEVDDAKVSDM